MSASAPLAALARRLRESQQRYDALRPLLPGPLAEQVQPGPIDDAGWTLLAANGAAASKLRQMLPLFEHALAEAGWATLPIRVRVRRG